MNDLLQRLRTLPALLFGNTRPDTHGQRRLRQIGRGFFGSAAQKTTGLLVSVLTVPLAVQHLGEERYGLWMAITSLLSWLAMSDLGLSYSLSLSVADAYGRNDREAAQKSVSSAFFALTFVAVVVSVIFLIAAPWIPWNQLFKVTQPLAQAELLPALIVAFLLFTINFPLSISTRVLLAYQEFARTNAWAIGINVLTLLALVLACWLQAGLPVLIGCFSGATVVVGLFLTRWLFKKHKPWLAPGWRTFDLQHACSLVRQGLWYFASGMTWAITSQIGTLIIASHLGATSVTPYSVAQRLFSYTMLVQSMVGGLLSITYTEARAKQDYEWIRRTMHRHLWLSGTVGGILCTALYFAAPTIITLWAGEEAVPTNGVLAWTAIWNFLLGWNVPYATLLIGLGRIKAMTLVGAGASVLSVILAYLWVGPYGASGVVAASTVAVGLVIFPAAMLDANLWFRSVRVNR